MTAGLEVVVRPVVFPNIRPSPPRILAPELDASRGITVLNGSSARMIELTRSEQSSSTKQMAAETTRTFDVERIYKTDEEGVVDKSTFVDVERLTKLTTQEGTGAVKTLHFEKAQERDNVEILETDAVRRT